MATNIPHYMETPKNAEEARTWARDAFLERQRSAGINGVALDSVMAMYDNRQNIEHRKDYGITLGKVAEMVTPGVSTVEALHAAHERFSKGQYLSAAGLVGAAAVFGVMDAQSVVSLAVPGGGEADVAATKAAEVGVKAWLGIGKAAAETAVEDTAKTVKAAEPAVKDAATATKTTKQLEQDTLEAQRKARQEAAQPKNDAPVLSQEHSHEPMLNHSQADPGNIPPPNYGTGTISRPRSVAELRQIKAELDIQKSEREIALLNEQLAQHVKAKGPQTIEQIVAGPGSIGQKATAVALKYGKWGVGLVIVVAIGYVLPREVSGWVDADKNVRTVNTSIDVTNAQNKMNKETADQKNVGPRDPSISTNVRQPKGAIVTPWKPHGF